MNWSVAGAVNSSVTFSFFLPKVLMVTFPDDVVLTAAYFLPRGETVTFDTAFCPALVVTASLSRTVLPLYLILFGAVTLADCVWCAGVTVCGAGVTGADGSLAGPSPAALVAFTVKVYACPLVRPVT